MSLVRVLNHLRRFGDTLFRSVLTILSAVVVDFLLLGCVLATTSWSVPSQLGMFFLVLFVMNACPLQAIVKPVPSVNGDAQPCCGAAGRMVGATRIRALLLEAVACFEESCAIAVRCRLYAFDVHCNSYFPLFLKLYGGPIPKCLGTEMCSPDLSTSRHPIAHAVLQYFLCPLLLRPGFISTVLSNALYGVSLSYYHYTQFLGYSGAAPCTRRIQDVPALNVLIAPRAALPFLDRTEFFLYPIAGETSNSVGAALDEASSIKSSGVVPAQVLRWRFLWPS